MIRHWYYLMLKDDKGEDHNVVIVNGWDMEGREAAFAALKALQSICDETCTAWLDVDEEPDAEKTEWYSDE